MVENLKIKSIYDDFMLKVKLNEEQVKIIDMLIAKESVVKISIEIGMSQRTVGYEIRKIKDLYEKYKQIEITKATLLKD